MGVPEDFVEQVRSMRPSTAKSVTIGTGIVTLVAGAILVIAEALGAHVLSNLFNPAPQAQAQQAQHIQLEVKIEAINAKQQEQGKRMDRFGARMDRFDDKLDKVSEDTAATREGINTLNQAMQAIPRRVVRGIEERGDY